MDQATALRSFVAAAHEAGQDYREVETLLLAANWPDVDQFLPALWEELANPPQPAPMEENTSGTSGLVPPEVEAMGFCWGAFGMTWIWGFANKVALTYLFLLVGLAQCILSKPWSFVVVGAELVGQVWLGFVGHRLAWRSRRYRDVAIYRATMRSWNSAGIAWSLMGASVVVTLLIVWLVRR